MTNFELDRQSDGEELNDGLLNIAAGRRPALRIVVANEGFGVGYGADVGGKFCRPFRDFEFSRDETQR